MSIFEYDEEAVLDYIGQKRWEDGQVVGKAKEQIRLVISKVRKNKTLTEIADMLEEDEAIIKPIYDVVYASAPEYDIDKIYKLLY